MRRFRFSFQEKKSRNNKTNQEEEKKGIYFGRSNESVRALKCVHALRRIEKKVPGSNYGLNGEERPFFSPGSQLWRDFLPNILRKRKFTSAKAEIRGRIKG